jgi:fumarate reductase flavoprotein subunit
MGFLTTALAPSQSLFEHGALLVNKYGKRFCDERNRPALALADQPGKFGYILIDGRLAQQFSAWPHFVSTAPGIAYAYVPDYRSNRPDVYTEAASLAELAGKLGMPPQALQTAVGERMGQAPFIALGPVNPVFVHNEGGLAVDTRHRVLGVQGKPIPGLYAAGSTGQGGLLLKGHGHHLAWAFVSGRRAGRIAASETSSS